MKKSIIAVSLATVFSLPAIADVDVQNPIWNEQPSNPIEQVPNKSDSRRSISTRHG